jgi:hypothetical protein
MSETYIYDKAKYYMTGADGGGAPSWERASGNALFLLRWLIEHKLVSAYFLEECDSLDQYSNGQISLFQLFKRDFDMVLGDDMLSGEGNAFLRDYFHYENGLFLEDLSNTLSLGEEAYPLFSERDYLKFKPVLDSRYAEWKAGNSK